MAGDIFLKLDGIKGEAKDAKYTDQIDVLAWSWGMSQSGTTHVGGGGGSGKVSVSDLSITKYLDNASPTLAKFCCKGTHIKDGTLIIRKAGDNPLEYLKIGLKEIIVSHIASGGSGGEDRHTEQITLNFQEFAMTYQKQDDKGAADGGPTTCNWNIAKNIAV